jgi:catechol 2,3-dioxygenase-like lactoylglutathione lyase family enzyme
VTVMASIESVTLDVADLTAANHFYTAAFGLGPGRDDLEDRDLGEEGHRPEELWPQVRRVRHFAGSRQAGAA